MLYPIAGLSVKRAIDFPVGTFFRAVVGARSPLQLFVVAQGQNDTKHIVSFDGESAYQVFTVNNVEGIAVPAPLEKLQIDFPDDATVSGERYERGQLLVNESGAWILVKMVGLMNSTSLFRMNLSTFTLEHEGGQGGTHIWIDEWSLITTHESEPSVLVNVTAIIGR